ncbi:hypothetical protein [Alkalihalobacillus pseudalcaliphilus]|uniref:hypothetical protein n=1 Tax=Alkalihalobacillus pseudalcaliphilus TaxID=79884 RepID=UPI00064D8588|nr:hypothetical protein [Alkalihalobacillus pseudalcaliphilus]KMK76388.1 hypothetical protein AB990_14450 [Alkalihalobacillus pseudalcaliphilus]
MDRDQIVNQLKATKMDDLLELVEDAESGYLEELELVPSIGLCYDQELNNALIQLLIDNGVTIIEVKDEE